MIKFLDLKKITNSFQPELGAAAARVLDSGFFVRGGVVREFEEAYAAYTGTDFCVGVGNGFDALRLIFRAWMLLGEMREGDEVLVPANTYIATILAVTENRLVPVLMDPDITTYTVHPGEMRSRITSRTRAILIVHLYGKNAMHPDIKALADEHGLKIVEDNAQATGCYCGSRRTGSVGHAAAHSFFPTKNLGAVGDGGAVTTDDLSLATTVRTLGNYGSPQKGINELPGVNSRLDELQAAVLGVKLARLDFDNARRREAAAFYLQNISHDSVTLPESPSALHDGEHVWHLFVIRCARRDGLQQYLADHGIETLIHYPVPPHKQRAYQHLNNLTFPVTEQIHREVLSLPLSPVIAQTELAKVVEAVNRFRKD